MTIHFCFLSHLVCCSLLYSPSQLIYQCMESCLYKVAIFLVVRRWLHWDFFFGNCNKTHMIQMLPFQLQCSLGLSTFTLLYNHLHPPSPDCFIFPNRNCVSMKHWLPIPSSSTWPPAIYFLSLWIWLLQRPLMSGVTQYFVFPTFTTSLFIKRIWK